jgi:multiple sugar transport system substrate-binding protein
MRGSIKRLALALSLSGLMMLPQVYHGDAATRNRTSNVTLNVWYHAYGEAGTHQAVQRYARQYEQSHPGVHINITWVVGQGAYPQKLNPALLSNNGPDVYENNILSLTAIRTHQVYPLDSLYTPEVRKDFNQNALGECTYKGHIYCVSMVIDTGGIYYRKSLFRKAGITSEPRTFDQLLADARKLNTGGVKGLFVGNDGGTSALGNGILEWSAGEDLMTGDKISYDNARTVKALQALRTLDKSGVLLLGAPIDWWDPSSFTQSLAAMQWCGLWAMKEVKKAVGDDVGYMPWPALDAQGRPATFFGGWNEYVNGKSHNLNVALDYVRWLWIQNTKDEIDFNTAYGIHIPPRRSAVGAAPLLQQGQAKVAVQKFEKYSHYVPILYSDASVSTPLSDVATAAVKTSNNLTPLVHQAAVKAQKAVNAELR